MRLLKKLLVMVIIFGIVCVGIVIFQGYQLYQQAIQQCSIEDRVGEIKSKQGYTTYNQLPEIYVQGVVAAEDRRFWFHQGIDFIATTRAAYHNLQEGKIVEGGSTITQQLGRLMYFSQEKKFSRKIAELLVANQLEERYSKEQILELYVNTIYFGSGYYQISEASYGYFGKSPEEMNDYECTLLAGIPNAPSVYDPNVNPTLAEERRQQVLTCMVESGYIEEGEIQ